jgi:benzoate-CoA ligase
LTERFGVESLDGIGSTEMLHIFMSNRPARALRHHRQAGPGYERGCVDEHGGEVADGELGDLQVRGPSSAIHYWNNRAKSAATFIGPWTRPATSTAVDADGYLPVRRPLATTCSR